MLIKNKIIVSIIAFILITVLAFLFVIYPLFNDIKDSSQELISQKENFNALRAKIESLKRFNVIYKENKEKIGEINNLFIDSTMPLEFTSFLKSTSRDYFLNTEIFSAVLEEEKKDSWSSLIFQIVSTGSFSNFLKFLEKLKVSNYLIEIQNLNISKVGGKEGVGPGEIKANFAIKVFVKQ